MDGQVRVRRATEPDGLRTGSFESAFARVCRTLRDMPELDEILRSSEGHPFAAKPLAEFYFPGRAGLGLEFSESTGGIVWEGRPGGPEGNLARDWTFARLVEASDAQDRAARDGDVVEAERARLAIQHIAYHLISVVRFGRALSRVAVEAGKGDDEALCQLVEIDKSALALPEVQERVIRAQHDGDWEFFEAFGRSIAQNPLGAEPSMFRVEMVVAIFWDWQLKATSYRQITELLIEHEMVPRSMNENALKKRLNRWGFKKIATQ